ncbi:hydantoinase/oxoprolinase family protein [Neobacillus niacini]|uniref:hydantoinase/oxoprolinase family protein n=1 Tax=Neobacillus niacini TaxID=86668 RepID=UPI0021CB5302|nr:hydantoinase/oxoprolinase family protein [Neobacillus niacini]MCM3766211.1 hydantoinase/oxoprolinase family protein [Neobacillus niacini]
MSKLAGVDVGGTFTDLFYIDIETGEVRITKVSSTPKDPSEGLIQALKAGDIPISDLEMFLHGTTIATNAIIQRKGCKAALVTTSGFRDILELGRRDRPHIYGLSGVQNPLIPRNLRFEVAERLNHRGEVITPLNVEEVKKIGGYLLDLNVDVVVVAFLHSYVNPKHELEAGQFLNEINPNWHIVPSSEILNEYYEFERTSTAVVEGYLRPLISKYSENLKEKLSKSQYNKSISIIQSNGGVLNIDLLGKNSSNIIRSGPAAGVIAASFIAEQIGYKNIITGDMGGTSFDVSLVLEGVPKVSEQVDLDFRIPLRKTMIDIHTIGAGGGSIAWIDRGGILQVGPQSAGAFPGPVCYNNGGLEPTVTDANLVLGRIDAENPIGIDGTLNKELAEEIITKKIAEPLGLSLHEAAEAILRVVNNTMSGRMRILSIEKGHDPRDFVFVGFGGAGPLHTASLIKEVGMKKALIPCYPGVICALGCVIADVKHDFTQTINLPQSDWDLNLINRVVDEKISEGHSRLEAEEIKLEGIENEIFADMSYEGQIHTIRVPLLPPLSKESIIQAFEKTYEKLYKHTLPNIPLTLINLRVSVTGRRKPIQLTTFMKNHHATTIEEAKKSSREVYFNGRFYNTPIYDKNRFPLNQVIEGPAIFGQEDTTIILEPDMSAYVDDLGNLIMEVIK